MLIAKNVLGICRKVLEELGTPRRNAEIVADHLVENDLRGLRSHGVLRLTKYIEQIESGFIRNTAVSELTELSPQIVKIDAKRNFGIVAFHELLPELIDRAKRSGIAAGALVNCPHTGRIGAYTDIVASHFMWAQIFGGGGNETLNAVAPFGGRTGVIDTNPYAASMPIGNVDNCTTDFATSTVAQGRVLVYKTNKTPTPEGWLIDKSGEPTTNAEDFYDGGAILPSAGPKGYGLAMIAELFGRAALGKPHELNWFMVVLNLNLLVERDDYLKASRALKEKIESCSPQPGFKKVMWPGQRGFKRKASQVMRGIEYSPIEIETIQSLASRFEVKMTA